MSRTKLKKIIIYTERIKGALRPRRSGSSNQKATIKLPFCPYILRDYIVFLALISLIQQYKTGTTSIVSTSIVIPPNEGIAIGTIISDPRPVEVRTGIRARIVVAVVIRHGLILREPAAITAFRICSLSVISLSLNTCFRYVHITTPSSEAMPNNARKPTQIATLMFIV